MRENKLVFSGFLIVVAALLVAVITPFAIPYSVNSTVHFTDKWLPSSLSHPLGTDDLGRDLLSVILWGTSTDFTALVVVLGIALSIGILVGATAGYLGGKFDEAIMRVTDVFLAFPSLILAMTFAAILGHAIINLTIAIALVYWPDISRLVRGQVIAEKSKPYIESLRASGMSRYRILYKHILPNTIQPVMIQLTFKAPWVIITLAGLNFLGFGPGPFTPDWGQLISNGYAYFFEAPNVVIFSGLALLIASLSFNLLGDGLRDVLDPRLRR
ncbi:MAG: ABC transporter permease [Thaumarchaeota archaeon]|nr:ABC transporter permease [Nitrososphaerota archaeon]